MIDQTPKTLEKDIATLYTLIPITQPNHQAKLETFVKRPPVSKTSFCRFYLRGICIMKPQCCKFAHKFQQLILQDDDEQLIKDCQFNQKQRKKLYFQKKQDFQQKALFILKNVDYLVLYNYQFQDKWSDKKSKQIYTVEQIKQNRKIRIALREVLHRQNWDKFIQFLINKYPGVDFSISFLSNWFSKVGFEKPQTRCRFCDFIRYIISFKGFKEVNIIMPPRVQKSVYFVNCNKVAIKTYLYENITEIQQLHIKAKQQYKKQLLIKLQPLPLQYRKKFICRYYMAGNCEQSQNQCKYAHSVLFLNYQIGQRFQQKHKQVVKGRQERLNYVSLHRYCIQNINKNITLQEINVNTNLKCHYRKIMHLQLYSDFMKKLTELTGSDRFKLAFIQQSYNAAGFNHSEQNKFGQFQSALFDIGYANEELKIEGEKAKSAWVYKIPPIEVLDAYFTKQINIILEEQVQLMRNADQNSKKLTLINFKQEKSETLIQNNKQSSNLQSDSNPSQQIILQSSFRKKLYRNQELFSVPLHVYLRIKQRSLQQIIRQQAANKGWLDLIFFETNEQNYKKLMELCRQYLKESKQYLARLQAIQYYIKSYDKEKINLNKSNITLKGYLQPALIDCGKRVYSLKFANNTFVINKANLLCYEKAIIKGRYCLKNYESKDQQILRFIQASQFSKQRIVIIDNIKAYNYAQIFLSNCNKFGVDLEGKLHKNGYIDLIQISAIFNQQKQIFIFDLFTIHQIKNQSLQLLVSHFLKLIFQDPFKVKILHDCKHDSAALKFLMNIELCNVFDTSGMHIILQQKSIYEKWDKKNEKIHQLLKRLFDVKVPGLNTVLEKWKAPNGVNIFKESMKKKFHEEGTRPYFEQRPIDPQFLEYSAQDVQDLIDVYQAMKKEDTQKISEAIGQIYSTFYLTNE